MNLFHHTKVYNILWALERVLEVDFIIFKNTTRHRLYRDLTLVVVRHLLNCQKDRERKRLVLESHTQLLAYDSDEEVPDLVPNDTE